MEFQMIFSNCSALVINSNVLILLLYQTGDKSTVIYEKGCLRAGEEWIEANLVPVAGVSVGVAVLQVAQFNTLH